MLFDRLRSKTVLALAPDAFYDVYNDLTFSNQGTYRPGTKEFRSSLFSFEKRALSQYFPSPPETVLVGGAGGGRETFALAHQGYRVVAFEPARDLAEAMARLSTGLAVESFIGRYEDLPVVRLLERPSIAIDLRSRAPFAGAIMGWGSFSHLRSDEHCIESLRQIGALTTGPILVSYLPGSTRQFSWAVGYYRGYSGAEFQALANHSGLELIHLDDTDNWPHAILRAKRCRAPGEG